MRWSRFHLTRRLNDALHAIARAVGHNVRWFIRAMQRFGRKGLIAALNLAVSGQSICVDWAEAKRARQASRLNC